MSDYSEQIAEAPVSTPPVDLVRAALERAWTADCPSEIYLARQVVGLRARVAVLEGAGQYLADVQRAGGTGNHTASGLGALARWEAACRAVSPAVSR